MRTHQHEKISDKSERKTTREQDTLQSNFQYRLDPCSTNVFHASKRHYLCTFHRTQNPKSLKTTQVILRSEHLDLSNASVLLKGLQLLHWASRDCGSRSISRRTSRKRDGGRSSVCPCKAPLLVMVQQATQLPALLLQCIQATGQGEQTTIRGVASWGHVGPRVPTGWLGRVHPLLHAQQGAWGNNAKGY